MIRTAYSSASLSASVAMRQVALQALALEDAERDVRVADVERKQHLQLNYRLRR